MNQQMDKPKPNGGATDILMNAFSEFKSKHDENLNKRDQQLKNDIAEVQSSFDRVEEILNRPLNGIPKAEVSQPNRFEVTVSGKKIPVLGREDRLSNHFRPQPSYGEPEWNLEDFVRNSMGINSRNNSVLERGSATVPEFLTSRIIDDIRAKNTLIKSGALTLPLDGKTVIGRIDTDPVAYLHAEGVDDIDLSLPVFSPVELDPGMIAVQIPLSVEIVADSANLDLLLRTSIAAAVAKKLDALGIAALLADVNIPESATGEDTETWSGLIAAAGSSVALNCDWAKAVISNAGDYTKRISQVDGTGRWIGRPSELLPMSDLFTTSMTAGKSIMGDFEKGLLLGMRQELRLEVVRWHQPGSASHLLVAYLRGQFYVVQPAAMYRQLKTVV
ncbi:phage major capsid protein [Nitrosomonas ureae]|uniref:Phage major capsid protein, HK97 family n=1 Tax=Nitrosomonas ureae TaxID=44577 RepID=A0A1H5XUY6_9PROT|nr:phage major capsid protein [Nitrosomonas ureae]SEG15345.1 phage major capsid protein, HK97 family [Nitrosomonas ureae]